MAIVIQHITVAQAATVINILIAFFQYTLSLGLAILLIHLLPSVNTAVAWNVIGRTLHSSLWPTLLGVDSESPRGTGLRVAVFSYLSFATTVLVIIAGAIMPLGLSVGQMQQKPPRMIPAIFVEDTSPLGLATSPRGGYKYGRSCVPSGSVTCGNYTTDTFTIPPDVLDRFNATPYGPFQMQFRRYYNGTGGDGHNYVMPVSQISMTESLILRTGIFAVGGLIVDMDNPGIGLWNHTLPAETLHGGVWSEDVLWLEPVTACVDTSLTIDYTLHQSQATNEVEVFNITDRGGFFNLTRQSPTFGLDGQNMDLMQHAYTGTVLSNSYAMQPFNNVTRNESYFGRTFQTNYNKTGFFGGKLWIQDLLWLYGDGSHIIADLPDLDISCQGYGGLDTINISNAAVHCNLLLAPPRRTDGGDPRLPADNSTWTQRMFGCASATRARMQRVEFSFDGRMDLTALNISRSNIDTPVVWATERTDLRIRDTDPFWGRVPDSLEADPSLRTIRKDVFYVPAGFTDFTSSGFVGVAQASTLPAAAWGGVLSSFFTIDTLPDYSGLSNFALVQKFQKTLLADPKNGPAQIKNLIWTDIMANNLMGTDSRTSLLVRENVPTVTYDLRYAAPALLFLLLWIPSLVGSVFILIKRPVISHLRHLLTHTGVGRAALGNSALRRMNTVSETLMRASG
ncbi:hypothetical protein DFH09DRAFT_1143733 [Mycena vulgaris]|nr:hypothetical protein DFH09DRAFT_1143733 [Mycena vulgaris]